MNEINDEIMYIGLLTCHLAVCSAHMRYRFDNLVVRTLLCKPWVDEQCICSNQPPPHLPLVDAPFIINPDVTLLFIILVLILFNLAFIPIASFSPSLLMTEKEPKWYKAPW